MMQQTKRKLVLEQARPCSVPLVLNTTGANLQSRCTMAKSQHSLIGCCSDAAACCASAQGRASALAELSWANTALWGAHSMDPSLSRLAPASKCVPALWRVAFYA